MNSKDLLLAIINKIRRCKVIVLGAGITFALLAFLYTAGKRTTYTSKATLFPLTSPADNALTSNMLSGILGLGDAPKSFSEEASINIVELALSRSIRESVAITRLPQFENKTIAELLVNDNNEHKSFLSSKMALPKDSVELAVAGGELLKAAINAKMSKNGVLELYYTGGREDLITPVSNTIISKLSAFYVGLKKQKAQDDYYFTLDKIDSLQRIINGVDREAITMQKRTMFTPTELLEYSIPKENISTEKTRVLRQRDMYINNRDEAVWRLQKVTPVIAVLDKPNAPFDTNKQPMVLLMLGGFIAGCIISVLVLVGGLLYRYSKAEIYRAIIK